MWLKHELERKQFKVRQWKQKDVGNLLNNGKEFRIYSKCMKLLEDFKQEWEYKIYLILVFETTKQYKLGANSGNPKYIYLIIGWI